MATYLMVVRGLLDAGLVGCFLLTTAEMLGRPARWLCHCRVVSFSHLNRPLLLAVSIVAGVASVGYLVLVAYGGGLLHLVGAALYGFFCWSYWWLWKKHDKDRRQGSLAKLRAKVKVTAAGLKVVPVKGAA